MILNQIKVALRNLVNNRSFSLINILGLALGMASCFLIILYCWHEFSYDAFQPEADRIYRVEYTVSLAEEINSGRIPPTVGPRLADYFSEIEACSRFYSRELSVVAVGSDAQFELEDVFFVDSTATHVFDFDVISGDSESALVSPRAVVLTDHTADLLFGTNDVVGRELQLAGIEGYHVTSVVKAWPDHSHLEFNMLLPYEAMVTVEPEHAQERLQGVLENNWIATHSYTYVRLHPNQDPKNVDDRFKEFIQEFGHERFRDKQSFALLPIEDIHLRSAEGGPKPAGNIDYLYLFLAIGIMILALASINFINITIASSLTRAKQIGVRKILGARRGTLIRQFIGESFLLSLFAFLIALLLTIVALPHLNTLTGLEITFAPLEIPLQFLSFVGILLTCTLLAGIYPAFVVTGFSPAHVLRGGSLSSNSGSGTWFRKALITFQFVVAIGFIAGSVVVFLQIRHMQNQSLGFNHELVVNLPINSGGNINAVFRPGDPGIRQRMNSFDESLSAHPKIMAVTQGYNAPGLGAIARNVWNEHVPQEDNFFPRILPVDYDYVETFDLQLVAGRDFDVDFGTDHTSSFMLNEQAMTAMGFASPEEALGSAMTLEGKEGLVVGILADFHYNSLHQAIDPLILEVRPGSFSNFSARIQAGEIPGTLAFIEAQWKEFFPEKVFEYSFLDESLAEAYLAEERLGKIVSYFSYLAIFISCFGLLGLAALLTQQRFKEIGIRKVLGASVTQILSLISREFVFIIFISMLIAAPLTWYVLKDWLAEFAYRINFPWWIILASGATVLIVAFITVSSQSARAAMSNPVDAIRE